ncbi:unnamed protein product [Brassica oleracea]
MMLAHHEVHRWNRILLILPNIVQSLQREGFDHHAEKGYVMLTYWILEEEPC